MPGGAQSPWVGQIAMVGFNFAPAGWAFCQGQLLPIAEYETLFNLIGTTYGGDGQTTFALPNLQSRVPIHQGSGPEQSVTIGEVFGVENVTLTVNQLPSHSHVFAPGASQSEPTSDHPDGNYPALGGYYYAGAVGSTPTMGAPTVAAAGSNQPHNNLQPFLAINFIISLFGIFPSQN